MPSIYVSTHKKFFKDFIEYGESHVINQLFDTFAKKEDEKGVSSSFACKIVTKLSPSVNERLQAISMIIPNSQERIFCLCNEMGTMTDISKGTFSQMSTLTRSLFI